MIYCSLALTALVRLKSALKVDEYKGPFLSPNQIFSGRKLSVCFGRHRGCWTVGSAIYIHATSPYSYDFFHVLSFPFATVSTRQVSSLRHWICSWSTLHLLPWRKLRPQEYDLSWRNYNGYWDDFPSLLYYPRSTPLGTNCHRYRERLSTVKQYPCTKERCASLAQRRSTQPVSSSNHNRSSIVFRTFPSCFRVIFFFPFADASTPLRLPLL
jgi:hypothetical protein